MLNTIQDSLQKLFKLFRKGTPVKEVLPPRKFLFGESVYIMGTQTESFVIGIEFVNREWWYTLAVNVEAVYPYDANHEYVFPESLLERY